MLLKGVDASQLVQSVRLLDITRTCLKLLVFMVFIMVSQQSMLCK